MARPLPDPVLFLDECLGTTELARALQAIGVRVEILLDHFESGTPDEAWLPVVGKHGWVVLTKDKWIGRRETERRALTDAGIATFVLTAGQITGSEMASAFCNAYPKIQKTLRDYEVPFVASVDASGRVRLLTDSSRRAAKKKYRKL